MSNQNESLSSLVTSGHYIATNLSNNLQVGLDSFQVREQADGLVVESKHRLFGAGMPVQNSIFALDSDWTPRRLDISAEGGLGASVDFGETETNVVIKNAQEEQRIRFPVGRRRAYFLMNGGLYFPMHLVRRFRFEDFAPQLFDLVPTGSCQVRRLEDVEEGGERLRQLEMRFQVEAAEDVIRLFVNDRGDLTRYRTRNQNLLVQLDERE